MKPYSSSKENESSNDLKTFRKQWKEDIENKKLESVQQEALLFQSASKAEQIGDLQLVSFSSFFIRLK